MDILLGSFDPRRPTVGWDFDGPLRTTYHALRWYLVHVAKVVDDVPPPEDWPSPKLEDVLPITPEEAGRLVEAFQAFCASPAGRDLHLGSYTPGASRAVRQLSALGYNQVVITGTPHHWGGLVVSLLEARFAAAFYTVAFTDTFGPEPGQPGRSKLDAMEEHHVGVLVEDRRDLALEVARRRPAILLENLFPWGKGEGTAPLLTIAHSMKEVPALVQQLLPCG